MDSHFLTDIDIIDFKCFQNFSAKGFKRVNLIGGKNNIGKTAFMEACYINVCSTNINKMITAIHSIRFRREKLNFIFQEIDHQRLFGITKNYIAKSNLNSQRFFLMEKEIFKEYQFIINNISENINAKELKIIFEQANNINFIDNFGWLDSVLVSSFQTIQKQDKELELNSFINTFDKDVVNFKVIGEKPLCKTNNQYRDVIEFGDGLKHYVSIFCGLYSCENGYLFIDEIGDGIHYQQLDRIWEIILTISKETNCQVFATTHSKEMIESFARVSQKLNEQDISYMTLVKNDKNEVKALVQDYEMFMYSMNFEHEVR
jgi:AAA15 family ATPase/GTPase